MAEVIFVYFLLFIYVLFLFSEKKVNNDKFLKIEETTKNIWDIKQEFVLKHHQEFEEFLELFWKKYWKVQDEINLKWFFILEVPAIKKLNFIHNLNFRISLFIQKYFIFLVLLFLWIYLWILSWISIHFINIFLCFLIFCIILYFLNFYIYTFVFLRTWKIFDNFIWIKSDFIIIFENKIIVDNKTFPIINWDLRTAMAFKYFIKNTYYFKHYNFKNYYKIPRVLNLINSKFRFINSLNNSAENLQNSINKIKNISILIEKNFVENKDVFNKSFDILENFSELDKQINISLKEKEHFLEKLELLGYENDFNREKFRFYILSYLINPLLEFKLVLENILAKTEKELLELEKIENEFVLLSRKRLKILKENLEKQILFLDEKLKSLKK